MKNFYWKWDESKENANNVNSSSGILKPTAHDLCITYNGSECDFVY